MDTIQNVTSVLQKSMHLRTYVLLFICLIFLCVMFLFIQKSGFTFSFHHWYGALQAHLSFSPTPSDPWEGGSTAIPLT